MREMRGEVGKKIPKKEMEEKDAVVQKLCILGFVKIDISNLVSVIIMHDYINTPMHIVTFSTSHNLDSKVLFLCKITV